MKKILSIILFFNLSLSYAYHNPYEPNHSDYEPECKIEEVGEEFGSGIGFAVGGITGTAIAAKIGVAGCAATGWWTLGAGCAASFIVGAGVGTYIGYFVGENIGGRFCYE